MPNQLSPLFLRAAELISTRGWGREAFSAEAGGDEDKIRPTDTCFCLLGACYAAGYEMDILIHIVDESINTLLPYSKVFNQTYQTSGTNQVFAYSDAQDNASPVIALLHVLAEKDLPNA